LLARQPEGRKYTLKPNNWNWCAHKKIPLTRSSLGIPNFYKFNHWVQYTIHHKLT
jgi:hypothetical protein